ncbi:hypothetical protein QBC32DRAFT_110888 [Pseudoneurospora amorphoporcata]|uniref:M protein, serotype 2.1 n=1 Tax=Pseudoneurospora amorphoporcata TaxID=241081 RepID=A0AAN6P112_9PEZI|nr:hypothetical protein QBC32DRAFT_110888 [Pseudoneurospora amorphoporcata]
MATVVKKPPASSGRETPTGTTRPAARASTPSSASSVARTRSIRSGTPVSARAAIQRRESLLGNGTNNITKEPSVADLEREEAARAETLAIIEDLKARLSQAEASSESHKRQMDILQSRLDDATREQAKLEEKVHEDEEQIEALKNEKREISRQMREMESIYEAERSAMMKEKDEMANREEEMQTVIQRLKDSLAQRDEEGVRHARRPSIATTSSLQNLDNGSFAPPSSIHRSNSQNNSKLLLQKDKLIESLRLELAEAQIKLVESENQGGGRLREVERQLMEARMANARLMEDNESYQLLLQERTLKGDFGTSDFSYMGNSANQDALAALEGRSTTTGPTSLADELSDAVEHEPIQEVDHEAQKRLEGELKTVKDQNKALTLYINKIIERLLSHQEFEHILDQSNDFKSPSTAQPNTNKELPPAPAGGASANLIQRAKSIATGGGPIGATAAARVRPRPMSFMPQGGGLSAPVNSGVSSGISSPITTNPDTAPSIPIGLGRSASGTGARRVRPLSEQYGPGASVASAMYNKNTGVAPSSASQYSRDEAASPLSPTMRTSGGSFFNSNPNRSSTSTFPGTVRNSETSSDTQSIRSSITGYGREDMSTASHSPPRSHHEKPATTFAGNKPRPLRLVQENAAAEEAARHAQAQQNKRTSWIGWAFGGAGGGAGGGRKDSVTAEGMMGGEIIRE